MVRSLRLSVVPLVVLAFLPSSTFAQETPFTVGTASAVPGQKAAGYISDGSFGSDLFYRLNALPIEMPSLRERREDIPLLVEYFVDRYARKARKNVGLKGAAAKLGIPGPRWNRRFGR